MHTKNLFIAEATIQKQNLNEKNLPGHYSHFRKLCWLSWKM